jgi:hypothetical protein
MLHLIADCQLRRLDVNCHVLQVVKCADVAICCGKRGRQAALLLTAERLLCDECCIHRQLLCGLPCGGLRPRLAQRRIGRLLGGECVSAGRQGDGCACGLGCRGIHGLLNAADRFACGLLQRTASEDAFRNPVQATRLAMPNVSAASTVGLRLAVLPLCCCAAAVLLMRNDLQQDNHLSG